MKLVSMLTLVLVALVLAAPVGANHPHWIMTPAGCKEDVAQGQTRKDADEPGGHKFHENVHLGTPGTKAFENDRNPVSVRKDSCP